MLFLEKYDKFNLIRRVPLLGISTDLPIWKLVEEVYDYDDLTDLEKMQRFIKEVNDARIDSMAKHFIIQDVYDKFCGKLGIEKYIVNYDGSINVEQDVLLRVKIDKFPVVFNIIEGCFDCSGTSLNTLENGAKRVHGFFRCNRNPLTSLKGGPLVVDGKL
jgi:hypothetical protein